MNNSLQDLKSQESKARNEILALKKQEKDVRIKYERSLQNLENERKAN